MTRALGIYGALTVADFVRMNLQTLAPEPARSLWYLGNEALFLMLSCYLLYKAIRRPALFEGLKIYEQGLEAHKSADEGDLELANTLFKTIEETIADQQLFRQAKLSITELAEISGLASKDVSWAINTVSQRNFCDYINHLRVNAVKQAIADGESDQHSFLDLALAAGFNAKSTFNAAFKKETELTPSQYQRQIRKPGQRV